MNKYLTQLYPVSERTISLLNYKYDDEHAMEFARRQMQSGFKSPIEYTEKIYKSKLFFECISNAVNIVIKELVRYHNLGCLDRRQPIAKLWLSGNLTPHYILSQGTIAHFKKSTLSANDRNIVLTLFNTSLDDYRRCRNAERSGQRKVKAIKEQLERDGIENITVRKVY